LKISFGLNEKNEEKNKGVAAEEEKVDVIEKEKVGKEDLVSILMTHKQKIAVKYLFIVILYNFIFINFISKMMSLNI